MTDWTLNFYLLDKYAEYVDEGLSDDEIELRMQKLSEDTLCEYGDYMYDLKGDR